MRSPSGTGTVSRHLHCVGADGGIDVSDMYTVNIETGGDVEVPALNCPPGYVVGSFGSNWTTSDGQTQDVTPTTETPE